MEGFLTGARTEKIGPDELKVIGVQKSCEMWLKPDNDYAPQEIFPAESLQGLATWAARSEYCLEGVKAEPVLSSQLPNETSN